MKLRSIVLSIFATALPLMPGLGHSQTLPTVPVYSYVVPTATETAGYAPNGNLLSYQDSVNGSWTMQYDSLNRIQTASGTAGTYQGLVISWLDDSFGNRLNQTVTGSGNTSIPVPSSWAVYNNNNQAISNQIVPAANDITYDGAGNNTFDGSNQYLYDAEGRICAALNLLTASTTQYFYDADGNRVAKAIVSSFTCSLGGSASTAPSGTYVLGPSGEQMTEFDGSGAWKHTNIFVGGQLLATYDTVGLHFPLSDPLGTVRLQASGQGVAEESFSSLPYGDGMVTTPLLGTASVQDATEHHFTGKERDAESGKDYFGARYYGSSMGRFMSPDDGRDQNPGNPQSWNLYSYVQNSPLTNIDPDGHTCQTNYTDGTIYDDNDGNGCITVDQQDQQRLQNGDYDAQVTANLGSVGTSSSSNSGNSGQQPLNAPSNCSAATPSLLPHGVGIVGGAELTAGTGFAGGTIQGSAGKGWFSSPTGGVNSGYFSSFVAAGRVGPYAGGNVPQGDTLPLIAGAAAGLGAGLFTTNARNVGQLSGPFTSVNLTTPIGSFNFSFGGGIWTGSMTVGPGAGAALSITQTPTKTGAVHGPC